MSKLLIVGIIIGLTGIAVLVSMGVVTPIFLDEQIFTLGDEVSSIDASNTEQWGTVPGQREYQISHSFFFFDKSKPQSLVSDGASKSNLNTMQAGDKYYMKGPHRYVEESTLEGVTETEEGLISYKKKVEYKKVDPSPTPDPPTPDPETASDDEPELVTSINMDAYKFQYSKDQAPEWVDAIHYLKRLVNFVEYDVLEELAIKYLVDNNLEFDDKELFYPKRLADIEKEFNMKLSGEQVSQWWEDQNYGFGGNKHALRRWGDYCAFSHLTTSEIDVALNEIASNYGVQREFVTKFKDNLCGDLQVWINQLKKVGCRGFMYCNGIHKVIFSQLGEARLTKRVLRQDTIGVADENFSGLEFYLYLRDVFRPNLRSDQKSNWGNLRMIDQRDQKRNEKISLWISELYENRTVSLLNPVRMAALFDAAKATKCPLEQDYCFNGESSGDVDLSKFTEAGFEGLEQEAFTIYSYLEHSLRKSYFKETEGKKEDSNVVEKEVHLERRRNRQIANMGSYVLNEAVEFMNKNFTQILQSAGMVSYTNKNCTDKMQHYFPSKNGTLLCSQTAKPNFDIDTLQGAHNWIDLFYGNPHGLERDLEAQTNYTLKDFENEFKPSSQFGKDMLQIAQELKLTMCGINDVKLGLKSVERDCLPSEVALIQIFTSNYTMNPPKLLRKRFPDTSNSYIDFFGLDESKYQRYEIKDFAMRQRDPRIHEIPNFQDAWKALYRSKSMNFLNSNDLYSMVISPKNSPFNTKIFKQYLEYLTDEVLFVSTTAKLNPIDIMRPTKTESSSHRKYLKFVTYEGSQKYGNPVYDENIQAILDEKEQSQDASIYKGHDGDDKKYRHHYAKMRGGNDKFTVLKKKFVDFDKETGLPVRVDYESADEWGEIPVKDLTDGMQFHQDPDKKEMVYDSQFNSLETFKYERSLKYKDIDVVEYRQPIPNEQAQKAYSNSIGMHALVGGPKFDFLNGVDAPTIDDSTVDAEYQSKWQDMESVIYIEPYSGIVLYSRISHMVTIRQYYDQNQVVPLYFYTKETSMSNTWITQSMGVYENKMEQKTIVRGVGFGCGIGFIVLAVLLTFLYCKRRGGETLDKLVPVDNEDVPRVEEVKEGAQNGPEKRPKAWLRNRNKRDRPIESSIRRKEGRIESPKEERFLEEDSQIDKTRQNMYFMNSRGERKLQNSKPGASVVESTSSRGDYQTQASSRLISANESVRMRSRPREERRRHRN